MSANLNNQVAVRLYRNLKVEEGEETDVNTWITCS